MVNAERLQLVEEVARRFVVLLLVAGGRRLVERFGKTLRILRNQVVVVARVVEAELLVRHPAESEASEVAHREEVRVGEEGSGLLRSRGVGHLAEEVLAFAQPPALDLDQARQVHRLRPETRLLGDLPIKLERSVAVPGELARAPVQVGDLASRLFGLPRRRHRFEIFENGGDDLGVEGDLGEPSHRATRVRVGWRERQETLQIGAARVVRAGRHQRIAQCVDSRVPLFAVGEVREPRALHEANQDADHFVSPARRRELLNLEQLVAHRVVRGHRGRTRVGARGPRRCGRRRGRSRCRRVDGRFRSLRARPLRHRRHGPEESRESEANRAESPHAHFCAFARTLMRRS